MGCGGRRQGKTRKILFFMISVGLDGNSKLKNNVEDVFEFL